MSSQRLSMTPRQLLHATSVGQPPVIVDVRSRSAFASGHIPNAISIPWQQLGEPTISAQLGAKPGSRGLVLVSLDGLTAHEAAQRFTAVGYDEVLILEGGLAGWEALGLPIQESRRLPPLQHQVQIAVGIALVALLAKAMLLHPVFYVLTAMLASLLVFDGLMRRLALERLVSRFPWNRRGTPASPGA